MAHSCPECGSACYCGGDIDDVQLQGTYEEEDCTHCDDFEEREEAEADEFEFGCHYPDRCCMPGEHLKSECHTAEDIIQQEEKEED